MSGMAKYSWPCTTDKNMPKRAIGIDVSTIHIHAVQMSRTAEGVRVEKTFFDDNTGQYETLNHWLQFLTSEHGFDRRSPIAWSLPHQQLFFRREPIDHPDRDCPNETLSVDTQHDFPLSTDEKITARCHRQRETENQTHELVTAIAQSALQEQLAQTENTKAKSVRLETPIFAVVNSVALNHPEILSDPAVIAYAEPGRILLAVTDHRQILGVRNLPTNRSTAKDEPNNTMDTHELLLREIELTWRAVREEKIPEHTPLILAGSLHSDTELQNQLAQSLPCRIIPADPLARIEGTAPHQPQPGFCFAEGLALRALDPDHTLGMDLEADKTKQNRHPISLKKQLVVSLGLLGMLGLVFLGSLFYRASKLEHQHQILKGQIRDVFQQTLPEEKTIVNELAQMQHHLQQVQDRSALWQNQSLTAPDPMMILHTITRHMPAKLGIIMQDLHIDSSNVRVTAVCDSFQNAYNWEKILKQQTAFASVDLQPPKKQSQADTVQFVMVIEMNSE
jgi:type II secretion system GspL-like protein